MGGHEVRDKLYDLAVSQSTVPDSIRERYASLKRHGGDCTGCVVCEKHCPFHVKIIERQRQAAQPFGQ